MRRYPLTIHRTAVSYTLTLLTISPLSGAITACNQHSLATKSGQPTSQTLTPVDTVDSEHDEIFSVVEVPPSFPGGMTQFSNYIRQNLRYPEGAVTAKVEGKAFVSFVVTKSGSIRQVQVLKGIGYGTNEEAARLIQSMPNWNPGKQSGRPVNVRYNVVVPFRLADAK